jgi:hypothetical protein
MSQVLDLFKLSLNHFLDQEVAPSYLDWEKQGIILRQL